MRKVSRDLLTLFDDAAKSWGWQSDQGFDGRVISEAKIEYNKSKTDLIDRIEHLEKSNSKLRKKCKYEKDSPS